MKMPSIEVVLAALDAVRYVIWVYGKTQGALPEGDER